MSLSREEIASYIIEQLNSAATANYHGENAFIENQRNYMRSIEEIYKNSEVTDRFNAAWKWLLDNGYLSEDPLQMSPGWYRLTTLGRTIKSHDQLQTPRVPRDMNPGPPPDFRPLAARDPGLLKHLHVLWEEAVLCFNGGAYLATIIMLGSLIEAALLAKALSEPSAANTADASPRDQDRNVLGFERWSLKNFLEVAAQSGWIHATRNDFTDILRDYRNLVHPHKAKNSGYFADKGMASICWQVASETLRDLGVRFRD